MLIVQCPECETSFKVSIAQLEVAQGQLQCGECQAVFFAEDGPQDRALITLEPRPDEIDLDAEIERERAGQGSAQQDAGVQRTAMSRPLDAETHSAALETPSSVDESGVEDTAADVHEEGEGSILAEGSLPADGSDLSSPTAGEGRSGSIAYSALDLDALSEDQVELSGSTSAPQNSEQDDEASQSSASDAEPNAARVNSLSVGRWVIPGLVLIGILQALYLILA